MAFNFRVGEEVDLDSMGLSLQEFDEILSGQLFDKAFHFEAEQGSGDDLSWQI